MNKKRILFLAGPILALILLLGSLQASPVQALDRDVVQRVMKSVVQIYAVEEVDGDLMSKWSGSGTIISQDGLILTNCHVALPRAMWDYPEFDYDFLAVLITIRSDEPPEPLYLAEVVQYDPNLDLAVIQVSHTLDGNPVDPDELDLPYLDLADSDEVEIGDPLTIMGYPGIGGETITLTSGNVSGFSRERGVEGRAWIKTDATIAGGNSGGTGVNEDGDLVGVPTEGGYGGAGLDEFVDCRYIADTNGDGVVDENDTCIPMGGFINALRPVKLAKPLIEAARRGLGPQPTPTPKPQPEPEGDAQVGRLIFTPAVNDYDQPVTVVSSFPSGTPEFYLVFDYANFQDGVVWQPELYVDGELIPGLWAPTGWDGGSSGTWWISIYNDEGLMDAEYEFVLNYDNEAIGSASVEVGGPPSDDPAFWYITFYGDGEEGFTFPAGIELVEAEFEFDEMTPDTEWSYVWYYQGEEDYSGEGTSFSSTSGTGFVSLEAPQGFDAGNYRLELYIEGDLAASSDFFVGGESGDGDGGGGDFFDPITFAEGADRNDDPVGVGTSFESGITELYAFFDYEDMQDNWGWTRRWSIDGEVVLEIPDTWDGGESGNYWISVYSDDGLPDGEYQLDLLVEGSVDQTGVCTIGDVSGPRPTPTPTDGVEIYGVIVDADTGRGIPGALFLVLQPGITAQEFQWTEDEVYAMGEADRDGYYELSVPLERGESYTFIVGARGYNIIAEDGITIPTDLESPYELNIELQQQ